VLLAVARGSIHEALGLAPAPRRNEAWLRDLGACFVTLTRGRQLRGCVGSVRPYRPLIDDVWSNARASAFSDSRFPPLRLLEWPEVRLEVSLLSAPEPLAGFAAEAEALALLRPGVDGLTLECGDGRGTFLPQVWEQLPDPRDFLGQLKRKAGFDAGFWSADVRLWRYTVAKWQEEEPPPVN
jgi:AmmeMemoRadiSam system protein A